MIDFAFPIKAVFAMAGVMGVDGGTFLALLKRIIAAAACGEAKLVPELMRYVPTVVHNGLVVGWRALLIIVAGAKMSGLIRESAVPRELIHARFDHELADVHWVGVRVSQVAFAHELPGRYDSVPPTVITFFARAGVRTGKSS